MKKQEISTEILNPSCSEQVFRLVGGLEDIRTEVLKMLDVVNSDNNNKKDNLEMKKLREKIKKIKDLEDFETFVFEFTCNYETYFKVEGNDLLVATCNNHEWEDGGVNFEHESEEDYSKISQSDFYKLIFQDNNYIVAEEEYVDNPKLVCFKSEKLTFDYGDSFKIIKKKGDLYILKNNKLKNVKEITDEKLKNKLSILAKLK